MNSGNRDSVYQNIVLLLKDREIGTTFIYDDFVECGSYTAIRSAVVHLCKNKELCRVCQGVYVKPKYDGTMITPSIYQIVKDLDRRNGGRPIPKGKETKRYIEGTLNFKPKELYFYTNSSTRQVKLPDGTIVKFNHREM